MQPRTIPQEKADGAGELQNYTIPSITDLFLEAGVQEICFLFADTLRFLCIRKNNFINVSAVWSSLVARPFSPCGLALLPDLSRLVV